MGFSKLLTINWWLWIAEHLHLQESRGCWFCCFRATQRSALPSQTRTVASIWMCLKFRTQLQQILSESRQNGIPVSMKLHSIFERTLSLDFSIANLYTFFVDFSRKSPQEIVQSLSSLIYGASIGELTSIERLVCLVFKI